MNSLIIPVYKNQDSIPYLFRTLEELNRDLEYNLEVVFVVDGSPDQSSDLIREHLPAAGFAAKLLVLSRNFGSFAAIRIGLGMATGPYFAVMSADLQEPASLILNFFNSLENEPVDVVIGIREGREDPHLRRIISDLFWRLYRRLVLPEMPIGGVDVFGCNQAFQKHLLNMREARSSLIAQIFWLGFRRKEIGYQRLARQYGKSAWTFRKRFEYMTDSIFSFTDFPIKGLIYLGGFGFIISAFLATLTLLARLTGWIVVPGYATTVLIVLFFGALNMFGLGVVGSYAWRAYENTKNRPEAILMEMLDHQTKENRSSNERTG
jgi:glycosyltransferase involved in cell wall biosynthesis